MLEGEDAPLRQVSVGPCRAHITTMVVLITMPTMAKGARLRLIQGRTGGERKLVGGVPSGVRREGVAEPYPNLKLYLTTLP